MLKPLNVATPEENVGTTAASKAVWPLAATAAAKLTNDRSEPSDAPAPKFSAELPLLSRAVTDTEKGEPDRVSATAPTLSVRKVAAKALLVPESAPLAVAVKV